MRFLVIPALLTACAVSGLAQTADRVYTQAPFDQPDVSISSHDRVYTADQFLQYGLRGRPV
jgi:hypothetical protein